MTSSFTGTLEFAKFLVTIFVMFYAYFFLMRTKDNDERSPWEYLFVAFMFLFLEELVSILRLFKGMEYNYLFFTELQSLAEFGFLAFLLFAVISQHYYLLKDKKIVIKKTNAKTFWDYFFLKASKIEKEIEESFSNEQLDGEKELAKEFKEMKEDEELSKEGEAIKEAVEK